MDNTSRPSLPMFSSRYVAETWKVERALIQEQRASGASGRRAAFIDRIAAYTESAARPIALRSWAEITVLKSKLEAIAGS